MEVNIANSVRALTLLELPINQQIEIEQVKSQYRKLCLIYHPDQANKRYKDGEKFKELVEAKDYLIDNINVVNLQIKSGFAISSSNSNTYYESKEEAERKAYEEAKRKEQERKAYEEAKRKEQERKAYEEAKRKEQERKAYEEAKRKEQERKAYEEAKRKEQERKAYEEAKRKEAHTKPRNIIKLLIYGLFSVLSMLVFVFLFVLPVFIGGAVAAVLILLTESSFGVIFIFVGFILLFIKPVRQFWTSIYMKPLEKAIDKMRKWAELEKTEPINYKDI